MTLSFQLDLLKNMTGISFKLPQSEFLFRPSTYGGIEHIVDNPEDYINGEVWYVRTVCQKTLKFNPKYAQYRQKDGRVRNACIDCAYQYELEEDEPTEEEKEKARKNAALPF